MYRVFHVESGTIVSRHETEAEALAAIDQCNEESGTYGRMDYDYELDV